MGYALLSGAELFLEHVHQQPVVPDAVGAALVVAHDPDPAKAHLLVSTDRRRVVGRRIDREAMVATLPEEVAGEQPDRFGAQPLAVAGRGEKDVYARMAIHRVVFLVVLYCADDLPVGLDDEAFVCHYELIADLFDLIAAPPPDDVGFVSDLKQPLGVLRSTATQQHVLSPQNDHIDPTPLSSRSMG